MSEALARRPAFVEGFAALPAGLADSGPSWLRQLRSQAHARFHELGLPHTGMEEWRQTSLAPLEKTAFRAQAQPGVTDSSAALAAAAFGDMGLTRLVFVNGSFSAGLSSPVETAAGVRVSSLAAALEQDPQAIEPFLGRLAGWQGRAFTALNTAYSSDGALVTLDANTRLDQPLQLVHVVTDTGSPAASFPRTLVVLAEGAEATIVESYVGAPSVSLTAAVCEVFLGDNASLRHLRVQDEGMESFHIAESQTRLGRDARYLSLNICLGAALARNDIGARMEGEGAEAVLDGLYLARGTQHVDNQTLLDHASPHCPSHELYKGILAGSARTVFNGRIVVREGAQKTNAIQSNRNLLLSDEALAHTRPQLEIYADDVRCTHGATIGQLDADALFYLRSRGIPAGEARRLLIRAFASDLLDEIPVESVRERLVEEIVARLPQG